ncbi:MAG: glycosyltransferase family 39 protein, partial [Candidatus Omnitrophica bacterium]|nr:glycosyltransferase family 39 protein [Candidatus Omnitrophota bacterium]
MNKNLRYCLILLLITYFFFMFGNSIISLSNPDEVFYTLTAKEMVKQHTWMTPYLFGQPQFEKPILLYWLLRFAFIIFGVTAFAARFFPAFFGMLGVLSVYFFGLFGFRNEKKAFICALTLASGGLYIG